MLPRLVFPGRLAGWVIACVASATLAQNLPPNAPVALQPSPSRLINPAQFLVESGPFSDPNPGDLHQCTDWEIWNATRTERVWSFLCRTGVERIRAALTNGTFENSLAGRDSLDPETTYVFRLRHRDNSGNPATEWSPWTEQAFTTDVARALFPLELDDVLDAPIPSFRDTTNAPVGLPAGASVALDSAGNALLTIAGVPGQNLITNPARTPAIAPVRVVVTAGASSLSLPEANLAFTGGDASVNTIYLPAIELNAGEQAIFWVAFNGSTYLGTLSQTEPDFSTLGRGSPAPWTLAPGWRIDLAATGFSLPVAIEFVTNPGPDANDPLYYVAELYGTIRVVLRSGEIRTYASGLLNFNPNGDFPGAGEQGLGDLAYDPDTGDLYMTYLYSQINGVENAPHFPAVDRFTSTDGGLTAATRTRILDMPGETQGQAHYISSITFGPDRKLYVHMGDGFVPETALNTNSFRGKLLRLNTDGSAPTDNPFYNPANGINARDYTYCIGLRNAFGGAWRFSDNALYFVENGPSVDRLGRADRGISFGYNGSDASMTINALYNWAPAAAPVNIGFVQPETFNGSGFPPEFYGLAYISQFGGTFAIGPGNTSLKSITQIDINPDGSINSGPTSVAFYNGTGASAPVALTVGPDGVYFSDFFAEFSFNNPTAPDANIYRLRFVGLEPPADCNDNGIPDADEIIAGTSLDCNGNGIPDACDIATGRDGDCNTNGVPDSCDTTIAVTSTFNTSLDQPWRLNGSATRPGSFIRLTPDSGNQIGSLTRPSISTGPTNAFDITFDFRTGQGSGADGLSFAAYDARLYNGTETFSEEGPGSTNEAPAGPGTLVVKFDTFDNFGEGENLIAIGLNGSVVATFIPPFDLEDFAWRRARVVLQDGTLSLTITNPGGELLPVFSQLPLPGFVPFEARFGFGGRTGGLTNLHDIDQVTFRIPGPNDTNANRVPDDCEPCSLADITQPFNALDIFDVLAFFNAFGTGDRAIADLNADGALNVFDIFTYFNLFAQGC